MNNWTEAIVNRALGAGRTAHGIARLAATLTALTSGACSVSPAATPNDDPALAPEEGAGRADLAPPSELPSCPTTGSGAIIAPGPCFVFTPAQAGASTAGANASMNQYALEPPTAPARGELVVFLNGSYSSPAAQIASPKQNLYSALAADGFHVLGLAYRSTVAVGTLCFNIAACFESARRSLVLGTVEPGAPSSLNGMRTDEGIVYRIDAALRLLAGAHPAGRWEQFSDANGSEPTTRVRWSRIIASGHSQGGGHAAYLGSQFELSRVVQLSSTCDAVGPTPAPWTTASGPWATSPAKAFVGFSAATSFSATGIPTGGDTICPYHAAVWRNMGLDPAQQHDDAIVCAAADAHSATIACTANAARWASLYK